MECVPWLSALVLHCAVRVLPEPPRATAAQPAMELPPSVKLTLPVGLDPVTDAVKVTLPPTVDGLADRDSVVVEGVVGGAPAAVQASTSVTSEYLPLLTALSTTRILLVV